MTDNEQKSAEVARTHSAVEQKSTEVLELIDAYAEARHRQGHSTYNAATAAARQAVVDALGGVQARIAELSSEINAVSAACDMAIRRAEALEAELEAVGAGGVQALSAAPVISRIREYLQDLESGHGRMSADIRGLLRALELDSASPTPPAEQQGATTEAVTPKAGVTTTGVALGGVYADMADLVVKEIEPLLALKNQSWQSACMRVREILEQAAPKAALGLPMQERPQENTLVWVADPTSSTGVKGFFADSVPCPWWYKAGLVFLREGDAAALGKSMRAVALSAPKAAPDESAKQAFALVMRAIYGSEFPDQGAFAGDHGWSNEWAIFQAGAAYQAAERRVAPKAVPGEQQNCGFAPTPPAEQQAQPGAVYAELPARYYIMGSVDVWSADQMRDFADRTHALRLRCKSEQARLATLWGYVRADATPQQAAPKAGPVEQQATLAKLGVGKSSFDSKTACAILNGSAAEDAIKKFVQESKWAHEYKELYVTENFDLRNTIAARDSEIDLLKKALMDAEAAPQQAAPKAAPSEGDWISADDVQRLVRELDVALNGEESAAPQASLCDIVAQVVQAAKVLGRPVLASPKAAPGEPPMPDNWGVVASVHGENILCIGDSYLHGKRELSAAEEQAIVGMAQHLLAFVGYGLPPSSFDPDDDAAPQQEAQEPAPSTAGGATYHLGVCIVDGVLHATVMRKEPGRAGAVTVLLSEKLPVNLLHNRDVIIDAAPQPAPAPLSEREAFEAWIKKDGGDLSTFGTPPNMHYQNSAVNNAWVAWKARAALAAQGGKDVTPSTSA